MFPDMDPSQDAPNLDLFRVIRVGIKYMPVILMPDGSTPKALYPHTVWRRSTAARLLFAMQEIYVVGFLSGMDHHEALRQTKYTKGTFNYAGTQRQSHSAYGERRSGPEQEDS